MLVLQRRLASNLLKQTSALASQLAPFAAAAQPTPQQAQVIYPPSDLDHAQLRKCTLTRREFIRTTPSNQDGDTTKALFWPSAAGQMCNSMAFGYSLFYKDKYIRPDLLTKALEMLAAELPPLAGRVKPPSLPPGLRKLGATAVELNGAGIELALAESRAHCVHDLGPHTWTSSLNDSKLGEFGVPFYAEPFNISDMMAGKEALFKVRLTRCADGHIVSVTVSHLLADAGRAVRLVERMAELYRKAAGAPHAGTPLHFNPSLETAKGFCEAVHGVPADWEPAPADHGLTLAQWMALPYRMYRHAARKFDVHMVYLPEQATKRLKQLAMGAHPSPSGTLDADPQAMRVSTMDAVQAFVATLVADLRRRPLVPTAPEEMTVNVDLLHEGAQAWKDPAALKSHVGNAVQILHVTGVDPGTEVPKCTVPSDNDSQIAAKLSKALSMNARLIRRGVSEFRSSPVNSMRALERQARMVDLPEAKVAAAFVVKGADMKVASTTAVTAFPFTNIDFGHGPPTFTQINYQPRFDWWTIIQDARGYPGGKGGVLCTLTLEAGLQDALVAHPAWRLLVPDADLIVASRQGEEEARDRYEQAVESDVQRRKHREARKEMAHVPALDVARREGSGERVGARGMRQHGLHTGSVRDLPSPGEWTSPR